VLVVQTRRLGDVLMLTPLLRALSRAWPAARVEVLVEPGSAPALAGNPHVSALVEASGPVAALAARLRRARYDVVIDAMGKSTSALLALAAGAPTRVGFAHSRFRWCYTHRATPDASQQYSALEKLALARALGIDDHESTLQLPGGEQDRRLAARWWGGLGLAGDEAPLAFAPVSRRVEKRWPPDRFAWLAGELAGRTGRRLLVFQGAGEAAQAQAVVDLAPHREAILVPGEVLPFPALPAAMARCAAYVGNDNGIRHVAVGLGLPTLAIFGPPAPANWTPPGSPHHLCAGGRRDIRSVTVGEVAGLLDAFAARVTGPTRPPDD
jgi:ADP-heptose:LPS heptosyltransferase